MLEIEDQFLELQKRYQKYLPKVDPELIDDLLLRQMENPRATPFYMIEVFTKPGLSTEEVRDYIISKTGMSPAIYDNGTHYVTNQQLTLDILKEISDSEDVIEVTGEYTGGLGSYGASHERSHEHSPYNKRRMITTTTTTEKASSASPTTKILQQEIGPTSYEKPAVARQRGKKNYKIAIYTAVGIAGAIALAGFIMSGGLLPNSNINEVIPAGVEPGALHGVVTGPGGLPAVGATVLAVQQGSDFVASSFVSVTGDYDIRLPPGNYVIYVAYPDGTDQTATVDIQRGSLQALN
ncbi:MAG: carboxypeptidase-like regulatory domain-containing protein, partial [Thermoproteota archaeon]|nr:carboxypeptidase-like regulatory domain-containing protein [Thermoproteota archaeon]